MNHMPSTFVETFHGGSIENYGNSMLQYSRLGKTDMQVSHLSLGGASFGKFSIWK